jgi:hypothetical protein
MKPFVFGATCFLPCSAPIAPPSRGAGMPWRSLEEAPGTRSRPSTSGNRVPLLDSVENSLYSTRRGRGDGPWTISGR